VERSELENLITREMTKSDRTTGAPQTVIFPTTPRGSHKSPRRLLERLPEA
jgi:hypothetical protein